MIPPNYLPAPINQTWLARFMTAPFGQGPFALSLFNYLQEKGIEIKPSRAEFAQLFAKPTLSQQHGPQRIPITSRRLSK